MQEYTKNNPKKVINKLNADLNNKSILLDNLMSESENLINTNNMWNQLLNSKVEEIAGLNSKILKLNN